MASHLPRIRPLVAADAPACDAVIASLPYHFGNADGRRECAEAVRNSAGLVAVEGDRVVGSSPWSTTSQRPARSTGWPCTPTAAARASAGR